MAAREYVPVPIEYLAEMSPLSDADFGRLIRALLRYGQDGTPVDLDGDCRFYAVRIMNKDDHYAVRAEEDAERAKRRSSHAKKAAMGRYAGETEEQNCSGMLEHAQAGNTNTKTKPNQDQHQDQTIPDQNQTNPREDSTVPDGTVCRTKDVRRVVQAWNSLGLQRVLSVTPDSNRGKMLRSRVMEYGVEGVLSAIENVRSNAFLKGQNAKGWVITFEWFVRPNNFVKVLEGNYDGKRCEKGETSNPFLAMMMEEAGE